jgi:hypothetical protein
MLGELRLGPTAASGGTTTRGLPVDSPPEVGVNASRTGFLACCRSPTRSGRLTATSGGSDSGSAVSREAWTHSLRSQPQPFAGSVRSRSCAVSIASWLVLGAGCGPFRVGRVIAETVRIPSPRLPVSPPAGGKVPQRRSRWGRGALGASFVALHQTPRQDHLSTFTRVG